MTFVCIHLYPTVNWNKLLHFSLLNDDVNVFASFNCEQDKQNTDNGSVKISAHEYI